MGVTADILRLLTEDATHETIRKTLKIKTEDLNSVVEALIIRNQGYYQERERRQKLEEECRCGRPNITPGPPTNAKQVGHSSSQSSQSSQPSQPPSVPWIQQVCPSVRERLGPCESGPDGGECDMIHPVLCSSVNCHGGRRQPGCTNWHTLAPLSELAKKRAADQEAKKAIAEKAKAEREEENRIKKIAQSQFEANFKKYSGNHNGGSKTRSSTSTYRQKATLGDFVAPQGGQKPQKHPKKVHKLQQGTKPQQQQKVPNLQNPQEWPKLPYAQTRVMNNAVQPPRGQTQGQNLDQRLSKLEQQLSQVLQILPNFA